MKEIYFAGGCFWGVERYFKLIDGVRDTETGYANGNIPDPSYEDVCTDRTGFAETVRVSYDTGKAELRLLVEMYFKAIDPLSLNRQGHDEGTQYRTGIYYTDSEDLPVIMDVFDAVSLRYGEPLAVEVLPRPALRRKSSFFCPKEPVFVDAFTKLP